MFKRRFTNFAENSPLILRFEYDDKTVRIIDELCGIDIEKPFDYAESVSDFIHTLRGELLPYYPELCKKVEKTRKISSNEVVELLLKGKPISEIPEEVTDVIYERYRVDKYIASKNLYFVTLLSDAKVEKYSIEPFGIFFIKNFREGKYADPIEAGDAFFRKAVKVE